MSHSMLIEVLNASQKWINNFNLGNIDDCVASYSTDAVMNALPTGTFTGTLEINSFWRPFIESGATDLNYKNVWLKQVDSNTVHLGADWSMNVGRGIITLEEWKKQSDGMWKLERDDFEVQEQFGT